MPLYILAITLASLCLYILVKLSLIVYLAIVSNMMKEGYQKVIVKVLLWLDIETVAKLYDGSDKNESSEYHI